MDQRHTNPFVSSRKDITPGRAWALLERTGCRTKVIQIHSFVSHIRPQQPLLALGIGIHQLHYYFAAFECSCDGEREGVIGCAGVEIAGLGDRGELEDYGACEDVDWN